MTIATVLLCQPEIKANRFRVTNVQIAIGLRRKSGDNLVNNPCFKIAVNGLLNKIERFAIVCHTAGPTGALLHKKEQGYKRSGIIAFRLLGINRSSKLSKNQTNKNLSIDP